MMQLYVAEMQKDSEGTFAPSAGYDVPYSVYDLRSDPTSVGKVLVWAASQPDGAVAVQVDDSAGHVASLLGPAVDFPTTGTLQEALWVWWTERAENPLEMDKRRRITIAGLGARKWREMSRAYQQRMLQILKTRFENDLAVDETIARKSLGMRARKWNLDWKDLVADQHHNKPPITPTTSYSDDFTNTDGTALPTHNANWADARGTWEIGAANDVGSKGSPGTIAYARYGADLSSDDHFTKITRTIQNSTTEFGGPSVRGNATDDDHYHFWERELSAIRTISKWVSSSRTNISNFGGGTGVPTDMKLDVSGTTLEAFVSDVSLGTGTDSSITSGKQGGMIDRSKSNDAWHRMDDWLTDDGAGGGGIVYTQLERGIRGYARGMWTGGV